LDTSEHSEESDIRSLTDSEGYLFSFGNYRSDYSEHALNARGQDCERLDLYVGIALFTCGIMEVVRQRFILTSPELYIFAQQDIMNM